MIRSEELKLRAFPEHWQTAAAPTRYRKTGVVALSVNTADALVLQE